MFPPVHRYTHSSILSQRPGAGTSRGALSVSPKGLAGNGTGVLLAVLEGAPEFVALACVTTAVVGTGGVAALLVADEPYLFLNVLAGTGVAVFGAAGLPKPYGLPS
jgi:hypothetical protein